MRWSTAQRFAAEANAVHCLRHANIPLPPYLAPAAIADRYIIGADWTSNGTTTAARFADGSIVRADTTGYWHPTEGVL